jgi:hypothetical protein
MNLVLILTIAFMSLLYLLIGFGINKDNAKYLLAGYNTMNQEEQDKFDIDEYLNFLKPFFKKLALYPPITYAFCSLVLKGDIIEIVWGIIQLLPFLLFIKKSNNFK